MNCHRSRRVRPAFTLIELLVVIAIIAILAAILFPVFAQAREKARMTACLSNTKQIALAIMQYAQDYDETLPVHGTIAQARGRWFNQLQPYAKNYDIFTCPNLPENRLSGGLSSDRSGFGWNHALAFYPPGPGVSSDFASGYPLADIAKPASTVIAGDTGQPSAGAAAPVGGWIMPPIDPRVKVAQTTNFTSANEVASYAQFRHHMTKNAKVTIPTGAVYTLPLEGRCNFVFLDGHAKGMNPDTAFEKAKGTPPTEDGKTCSTASMTSSLPDTEYVLWNIF